MVAIGKARGFLLAAAAIALCALGLALGGSATGAADQPSDSTAVSISAAIRHTCAVRSDAKVVCWGSNWSGELGDGTLQQRNIPTEVLGIDDAVVVETGGNGQASVSCAIHSDRTVSCWGDILHGRRSVKVDGIWEHRHRTPSKVPGLSGVVSLAVGGNHLCAAIDDGTVSCLGSNTLGLLGNGMTSSPGDPPQYEPTTVTDISDAVAVTVGHHHSCALHENATVSCWGRNAEGQLGDGTTNDSNIPVKVPSLTDVQSVTVAGPTCVTKTNGTVTCWGRIWTWFYQAPDELAPLVPTTVGQISNAVSVSMGLGRNCVLHDNGTVSCWSDPEHVWPGDGPSKPGTPPMQVGGLDDAVALSMKGNHACVIRAAGTVSCWGFGDDGKLGQASEADAATPLPVIGLSPASSNPGSNGYWMLEADGDIRAFGDAQNFGDTTPVGTSRAISIDSKADGSGFWVLDWSGRVHARGSATHYGDMNDYTSTGHDVQPRIIMATPTGEGYWIVTARGHVFAFGDAVTWGDLATIPFNGLIIAAEPTPTGNGYYLLGDDGGVFAFGDAKFHGSIPGVLPPGALSCPIVGITSTPTNNGYWLVGCDGGIFAFGDANFRGSVPGSLPEGTALNAPVNGMVPYASGYLMVASDGGIFNYSDRAFDGSLGGTHVDSPIIGVAAFVG